MRTSLMVYGRPWAAEQENHTVGTEANAREVSVSRVIAATPEAIFAVIADPSRHPEMDGSGTVKASNDAEPQRLEMGSTFGMSMKMGVPYRIKSKVVEFDENRLIAWQHFGKHRWRYELAPVEGGTEVTETFDWSTARSPWFIEKMGYPTKHVPSMEKTLERLEGLVNDTAD